MNELSDYMTTSEVVAVLGVSHATFYRSYVGSGGFPPPRKFGRQNLWPRADIMIWKEKHGFAKT